MKLFFCFYTCETVLYIYGVLDWCTHTFMLKKELYHIYEMNDFKESNEILNILSKSYRGIQRKFVHHAVKQKCKCDEKLYGTISGIIIIRETVFSQTLRAQTWLSVFLKIYSHVWSMGVPSLNQHSDQVRVYFRHLF